MRDLVYAVEECYFLTPTVAQIFLRSAAPLEYAAGQYIQVIHPNHGISPLSIANAPTADFSTLELHLRHPIENTKALDILRQVTEEKCLTLRGPYGQCTLSALDPHRPVIFLARSTGFAPIKAIIEAWTVQPNYPPLHLYWSAPTWGDIYLSDIVKMWMKNVRDFRFTAVLTREFLPEEPCAKFGTLPHAILQDYPDLSSHQVYASGPQTLIYTSLYAFQQHGLSREWFYSDVL